MLRVQFFRRRQRPCWSWTWRNLLSFKLQQRLKLFSSFSFVLLRNRFVLNFSSDWSDFNISFRASLLVARLLARSRHVLAICGLIVLLILIELIWFLKDRILKGPNSLTANDCSMLRVLSSLMRPVCMWTDSNSIESVSSVYVLKCVSSGFQMQPSLCLHRSRHQASNLPDSQRLQVIVFK